MAAFKLFLVLLTIFATAFATFTPQTADGVYRHTLDANGTEIVERIGDISRKRSSSPGLSTRQTVNWPEGTSPTCVNTILTTSDLYNHAYGEEETNCQEWVGGGIVGGISATYGSVTAYWCSYSLNMKCVVAEWIMAVS